MAPIIQLTHEAEVKLTAWALVTKGREFSGLGLIEKQGDVFHVVDVDLLGVGSEVFTVISPDRQRALGLDERRKLWFHRHPVGSGDPGPHNWSGTDHRTATEEPLGGHPKLVAWSVAIVLTPGGWTGRVDIHVPQLRTFYCPVEPRYATEGTLQEAREYITPELEAFAAELLEEFHKAERRAVRTYNTYAFDDDPFDLMEEPMDTTGLYSPCCGVELQEIDNDYSCGLVEIHVFECSNCMTSYATIRSDVEELIERQSPPPTHPAPVRKQRSFADWRKSWDTWKDKR